METTILCACRKMAEFTHGEVLCITRPVKNKNLAQSLRMNHVSCRPWLTWEPRLRKSTAVTSTQWPWISMVWSTRGVAAVSPTTRDSAATETSKRPSCPVSCAHSNTSLSKEWPQVASTLWQPRRMMSSTLGAVGPTESWERVTRRLKACHN